MWCTESEEKLHYPCVTVISKEEQIQPNLSVNWANTKERMVKLRDQNNEIEGLSTKLIII